MSDAQGGDEDGLARKFAVIAAQLYQQPGVEETVEAAATFAASAVGCDAAGIMLLTGGRIETVAVSDPAVARADALQTRLQEGPCAAAAQAGDAFLVADTVTEQRWPRWSREVAGLGLRSVLGVVMEVAGDRIGALNLYDRRPNWFSQADVGIADIVARHAAIAVAGARKAARLVQAVDSRALVGIAIGILMERYDLTSDEAFGLLERYSRETGTKLLETAQELISHGQLPRVNPGT